jgi:tetraacyldisaccharide 4'-kinase
MDIQNFIDNHLRRKSLLSYLLSPVGFMYGMVQEVRRVLYGNGLLKSYQAKMKVISIGNIVSGGAGKTPFTIYLCKLLQASGKKVVVSHRGYKGEYENSTIFISNREKIFELALKAGDEPLLLARNLPQIPIVVGRDRTAALKLVEETYPDTDYILLDDSYQHLKVKHDYDFVVFNSGFGIGNGFVLPAGLLREFISSLKHVTAIIWNQLDEKHIPAELLNSGKEIIKFSYEATGLYDTHDRLVDLTEINRGRNALLSGIGYPEGFERSARDYGIHFEKHFRLSDHFDYQDSTFRERISKAITDTQLNSLIITEKDFVKLQQLLAFSVPYYILKVKLIASDDSFIKKLLIPNNVVELRE